MRAYIEWQVIENTNLLNNLQELRVIDTGCDIQVMLNTEYHASNIMERSWFQELQV